MSALAEVTPLAAVTAPLIGVEETITPEIAARMLERNHLNRRISSTRVDYYAKQIRDGRWMVNHQGVAIDTNGDLRDGQHRLHAVVLTGIPVQMMVTRGVSPEAMNTVDTGRVRSGADMAVMAGISNATLLISAAKISICYESGIKRSWDYPKRLIAPDEALAWLQANPAIGGWVNPASAIRVRLTRGTPAAYCAALYQIEKWCLANDKIDEFADWHEGLRTGVGLQAGDARVLLARWMTDSAKKYKGRSEFTDLTFVLTLRTFNAHINGERLGKLQAGQDPNAYTVRLGYYR